MISKWNRTKMELTGLVGHYCGVVLHSWCLLFGAILGIWCSSYAIKGILFTWKEITK